MPVNERILALAELVDGPGFVAGDDHRTKNGEALRLPETAYFISISYVQMNLSTRGFKSTFFLAA